MDNQGAIFQCKRNDITAKKKHVAVDFHFVREMVKRGEIVCV